MSVDNEQEIMSKLRKGENLYYSDGLNHKAFAGLPNLTLETTKEEEDRMIDEYNLEYCSKVNIDMKDPEFDKLFEVMHLMVELFVHSYCDGLKAAQENKTSA